MKDLLLEILTSRTVGPGFIWLDRALASVAAGCSERTLSRLYTEASRFLGKFALSLTQEERARLARLDASTVLESWAVDDAARALLLIAASAHLGGEDFAAHVRCCYKLGDSREQQSWLRGLSLLPGCEIFVDVAIDSCRTNILPLFQSVATDNPYPSRYFPDLNFNQMVMKCLFNAVPLDRIVGLDARLNPELSRMALSYASERQAAGRSVPADLQRAVLVNA